MESLLLLQLVSGWLVKGSYITLGIAITGKGIQYVKDYKESVEEDKFKESKI